MVYIESAQSLLRAAVEGAQLLDPSFYWYRPITVEYDIPGTVANHKYINQMIRDNGNHDKYLAYLCAVISCWSYTDLPVLSSILPSYGFGGGKVTQFQVSNDALLVSATAFLILSADGTNGILAFRGTEPANIISILTDLNSQMTPCAEGEVHSGFLLNTEVLRVLINEKIEAAMNKLERLYITGHSLGGAMAVVTAAKAIVEDNVSWAGLIKGIYTYGQPMVGNSSFARECGKRFGKMMYRHVYNRDVVPHIPSVNVGDYKHFGKEYFSSENSKPWSSLDEKGTRSKASCSIGLTLAGVGFSYIESRIRSIFPLQNYFSKLMSERLFYSVDDHSPMNYILSSKASLP
jgi:Lipase (class 3)